MKYAIVIPDGCADEPQASLGGKTPLQAARKPNMDQLARAGVVGRSNNVPQPLTPASDVATLSLFGYDPLQVYTGRAPLETAAMGIALGPEDWAIRCNLVNIENETIRAVDLVRGVGVLLGWKRIDVPGTTGYLDTDYAAKGRYAIAALRDHDLVCVHVEAPDEASHEGKADEKVKALERIDEHIVGPLLAALPRYRDWRILVSPDHRTTLKSRAHAHGAVPFAAAGKGLTPTGQMRYEEAAAA